MSRGGVGMHKGGACRSKRQEHLGQRSTGGFRMQELAKRGG